MKPLGLIMVDLLQPPPQQQAHRQLPLPLLNIAVDKDWS
jgi:hypothetical protein